MEATQTAPVVMGLPDPEVFFWKTELGAVDALCSQCGGRGSHWWHLAIWALRLTRCARNCARVLRIALVSSQGNEEVPAVTCEGTPVWMVEMKGRVAPPSAIAEQAAVEGLLALGSPP